MLGSLVVILLAAVAMAAANIDSWRILDGELATLANAQGLYALVPFLVALRFAGGDVRRGVVLGAAQGAASIGAYYSWSWLVHGQHSAGSQLAGVGAGFWLVGATIGGAVFGAVGALAASRRRRRSAAAYAVTTGLLFAEAWRMASDQGKHFALTGIGLAVIVLAGGAGLLLGRAVRRGSWRRTVPGALLGLAIGVTGFVILVLLEDQFAYPTL